MRYFISLLMIIFVLASCKSKKEQEYHSARAVQRKQQKTDRRSVEMEAMKSLNKMTYDELKKRSDELLLVQDTRNALRYMERMLILLEDHTQKQQLLVKMAELYFEEGKYKDAAAKYLVYVSLYPGGEHVELAYYKAILAYFYRTLSYDRDQALTRETLELVKEFLNTKKFATYQQEVVRVSEGCYQKLFDHEKEVIDQKLGSRTAESLKAAQMRLAYLKEQLVPACPVLSEQLGELEQRIMVCVKVQALTEQPVAANAAPADATLQLAAAQHTTSNYRDRF